MKQTQDKLLVKQRYGSPELNVFRFDASDVITTSGKLTWGEDWGDFDGNRENTFITGGKY